LPFSQRLSEGTIRFLEPPRPLDPRPPFGEVVEVINTNENRRDNNPLPVVGLSSSSVVNPLPDPSQGSGKPVAELSDAEVNVLARALLGAVRKKFADPKFVARYEKSRAKKRGARQRLTAAEETKDRRGQASKKGQKHPSS
jgi:hypothetical protein